MRRALIPLLFALILPAASAHAATCAGAHTMPSARTINQTRAATLCLLNQQRRAHGLPALHGNSALRRAATSFSRQMRRGRFFDHTAPDGTTFDQRIEAAGYGTFAALAENIAWGAGSLATPAQIVNSWMGSPGHRRNILDGRLRDIGIGIVSGTPQGAGARSATYTTDFGRRR